MSRPPTILAAVLKGKLGRVKNSEDWLTAVIFGTLSWLPVSLGLKPMLRRLTPGTHGVTLPDWVDDVVGVSILLWPWWDEVEHSKGAEPDVVLKLTLRDGGRRLLLIECKRGSDLGHDQLGRQAANAAQMAVQLKAEFVGIILLTSHVARPDAELGRGTAQLAQHAPDLPLWWLPWSDFEPIMDRAADELRPSQPLLSASASDAADCLRRWGLTRFRGLSIPTSVPHWTFPSTNSGAL